MSYLDRAKEIDKFLREKKVTSVRKCDLTAKFNLGHDEQSAVFSALTSMGWTRKWFVLELRNPENESD